MQLDDFDRRILEQFQNNSRITSDALGHQIGLSATACQRRLKKLRDSGLIAKEVAVLSFDDYVTVIVEVVMKRGGTASIESFKSQALQHQEIQQCYYTTGSADFIVVVVTPNMAKYEELTRNVFLKNDNIHKFHSTVVMENVKVGLDIPIELSEKALPASAS